MKYPDQQKQQHTRFFQITKRFKNKHNIYRSQSFLVLNLYLLDLTEKIKIKFLLCIIFKLFSGINNTKAFTCIKIYYLSKIGTARWKKVR